jgi:hypothetical protein
VSPPERPGYARWRGSAQVAAGAAAFIAVVAIGIFLYGGGSSERLSPAPHPGPAGAPAPQPSRGGLGAATADGAARASERDASAQAKLASVRDLVELRLEEGRYDEAHEAVRAIEAEVSGTAAETGARELRERVRREIDRALEFALRKARSDLASGRPDLALLILRDAPDSENAELTQEKSRLKLEAERAARPR